MADNLAVAAERTYVDHEELRTAIADVWRSLFAEEPTHDAVAILLAQSALETGKWASCFNWNLGGLKSSGASLHTFYTTTERMPRAKALLFVAGSNGLAELVDDEGADSLVVRCHPPLDMCRFRAYRSLGEAATGYVALLARRYGLALAAAKLGDVDGFVRELHKGGYFTADVAEYTAGVRSRFDEYREPCLSTQLELAQALEKLGFPSDDLAKAVRAFQSAHGLAVDAIVGPATRRALRVALMPAA